MVFYSSTLYWNRKQSSETSQSTWQCCFDYPTERRNSISSIMAKLVRANTKIEVTNYNYEWTIQNFKFSCNRPVGKAISSPVFTIPTTKIKGCLKIYPGGVFDQYKNYVSVYLELKNYEVDNEDLIGEFLLRLPHTDVGWKDSGLVNFSLKKTFGFPDYIDREHLLNNVILVEESLTLICSMRVSAGNVKNEIMIVEDTLPVQQLGEFDVILNFGNRFFDAHKSVLAGGSKKFKKMFEDDWSKSEFEIKDMSVEFMKRIMDFIYDGTVDISGLQLMDFLKVVQRYELNDPELQKECEVKLCKKINYESAVDMFTFAKCYRLYSLYDYSLIYIVRNFQEIRQTKSYKNLLNTDPDLVAYIYLRVTNSNLKYYSLETM